MHTTLADVVRVLDGPLPAVDRAVLGPGRAGHRRPGPAGAPDPLRRRPDPGRHRGGARARRRPAGDAPPAAAARRAQRRHHERQGRRPSPRSWWTTSRSTSPTPTPTSRSPASTTRSPRPAASRRRAADRRRGTSRWAGSATSPRPSRWRDVRRPRCVPPLPPAAGRHPGRRPSRTPWCERVAVLGGAGDDLFDAVRASGADVYVTADLRHHPVLEAREEARGGPPYLVDAGHWASESLWLAVRAERRCVTALGGRARLGWRPTSQHVRTDPWTFVVGAEPPAEPEVRPERRPVPPAAAARPAGHRHPARPDRARAHATCRSSPSSPTCSAKAAADSTTSWCARAPSSATSSARSPRPSPTCSWCATGPPATRPGSTPAPARPRTSRPSSTS